MSDVAIKEFVSILIVLLEAIVQRDTIMKLEIDRFPASKTLDETIGRHRVRYSSN